MEEKANKKKVIGKWIFAGVIGVLLLAIIFMQEREVKEIPEIPEPSFVPIDLPKKTLEPEESYALTLKVIERDTAYSNNKIAALALEPKILRLSKNGILEINSELPLSYNEQLTIYPINENGQKTIGNPVIITFNGKERMQIKYLNKPLDNWKEYTNRLEVVCLFHGCRATVEIQG